MKAYAFGKRTARGSASGSSLGTIEHAFAAAQGNNCTYDSLLKNDRSDVDIFEQSRYSGAPHLKSNTTDIKYNSNSYRMYLSSILVGQMDFKKARNMNKRAKSDKYFSQSKSSIPK
jgi:hypothetical protein